MSFPQIKIRCKENVNDQMWEKVKDSGCCCGSRNYFKYAGNDGIGRKHGGRCGKVGPDRAGSGSTDR